MSADPFIKLFIGLLLYLVALFVLRSLNVGRKKVRDNKKRQKKRG